MIDPLILMDGVRDGHGALVDLRYADANQAAIDYNTIPREELIGARLLDLFPGQLEHGPLRQYFHTIETGEPDDPRRLRLQPRGPGRGEALRHPGDQVRRRHRAHLA